MATNWERQGGIAILPNGIDFLAPNTHPAFVYESRCFRALTDTFPRNLIIGPHLVDFVLGQDRLFSQLPKPDALIFRRIPDGWLLTGLAEIKSGQRLRSTGKLHGFSIFLNKLRSFPGFLPGALERTIGDIRKIPAQILIPPDPEITIIFIGRHPRGQLYKNGSQFAISYLLIP